MTPEEERALQKGRRRRSIALGLSLAVFVVLVYVLSVVKMGPAVFSRGL